MNLHHLLQARAAAGKPVRVANDADVQGCAVISGRGMELVITLGGDIDENASFVELAPRLRGHVVFDLSGVRRINSCGVREWVTFHRDLVPASVTSLEFRACSPQVVAQLNSIANFRGRASVRSFIEP